MNASHRRAWERWLLIVLILSAFALRLYRLDAQDIWWDEARNVDVAARPLASIATAGELDIHPPIYFYLLHGWLGLSGHGAEPGGEDAFAVRFLSLWFGVLFVALMYALGRRLAGFWAGLGAAVGAACLPFLLGEAQEARMYTVTLVWLAAAGLALLRASVRGQEGASLRSIGAGSRHWLFFAFFSALALLTHYAAVFALAALWGWAGLWALTGERAGLRRRLAAVVLTGLVTALFCLPGLPVALRQIGSYRNPNLVVPSAGAYLAELARVYGLGEHVDATAMRPWAWGLAGLLVAGWLLAVAKGRTGERLRDSPVHPFVVRQMSFAALWAILPLLVYYLVIADRGTFASRYICVALPGWLLLGGLALRGWAQWHRIAGSAAALGLIVVLVPGVAGDLTDPRFFREDTRGLAAWLRQEADPVHDVILMDQRYPFGLYWPRWNYYADGFPPAEPADLAPAQYFFVDINTVAERLTSLARGRERVFLVRWFESDTDPRGSVPWLLEKFGTRLGERSFRGYQVAWYATPPEAGFELAPQLAGPAADFGDQVRLNAYAFGGRGPGITSSVADTRAPQAPADKPIWVVARWLRLAGAAEPGKALPRGLKATVILEDIYGDVVGRDDRPILNDRHVAPVAWLETDNPLGVYLVRADPATPPGVYTLKLAIYDPATLALLPAAGSVGGSFVELGQVTLTRPAVQPAAGSLASRIEATPELAWRGLRLLGRGPLPAQVGPGDQLAVDLFWQAEQDNLPDLRAQLALMLVDPASAGLPPVPWEAPLVAGHATDVWQAGEVLRGRQQVRLAPDASAGTYRLVLRLLAAASAAAEAATSEQVDLGQVIVAGRSHVFDPPAGMTRRSGARFGELASLVGYDLPATAQHGAFEVTLYWRAESASAVPHAGSVQLLDAVGALRAQRDQQPGDGALPTTGWVTGEVLTDLYRVTLPADLPAGGYTVIVKLYNAETGAPLPVTEDQGAAPAGEFLRLGVIQAP